MHSVTTNSGARFFAKAGCFDWVAKLIGLLGAILILHNFYLTIWFLGIE